MRVHDLIHILSPGLWQLGGGKGLRLEASLQGGINLIGDFGAIPLLSREEVNGERVKYLFMKRINELDGRNLANPLDGTS